MKLPNMPLKRDAFLKGLRQALPLWAGGMPVAIVYAVTARQAGFAPCEIQAMSLLIYSAVTQLGMVTLLAAGAPTSAILPAAVMMNIHHVLYGISLAERLKLAPGQRAWVAFFLTDSVYGLAMAAEDENIDVSFLAGIEASLFFAWNVFTALGLLAGQMFINPAALHLDFIAPLTFGILLAATIKTRLDTGIASIAAGMALVCLILQAGSLTLPVAVIAASWFGARLMNQRERRRQLIR